MQEVPDLLLSKGFTTGQIRFWNGLQSAFASEKRILVEFDPEQYEKGYWQMYIAPERGKSSSRYIRNKDLQLQLNEDLEKCFNDPGFRVNQTFWGNMGKSLQWRGCFVPYQEILTLHHRDLRNHLIFLHLKIEYFPYINFLSTIKQQSILLEKQNIPLPLIAIWYYFVFYTDFLKEVALKDADRFKAVKTALAEHFSSLRFDEKLPSAQIVEILFQIVEQAHSTTSDSGLIDRLIKQSLPPVQVFFELYRKNIEEYAASAYAPLKKVVIRDRENQLRDHFFSVCLEDLNLIKVQDLLDDASGYSFLSQLPEWFIDHFGKNRRKSMTDRLKDVLGDATIMERIQAMRDKAKSSPQPGLQPEEIPFSNQKEQQWHQLNPEERTDLLNAASDNLEGSQLESLETVTYQRWMRHNENLLNKLTMPFIIWEIHQEQLIPQWNCFGAERAKSLEKEFWKKRAKEKKELEILEKMLPELYKKHTKYAFKKFIAGFKGFEYIVAQDRWEEALEQHWITIENRSGYRMRRMQEYGILESHEKLNDRKELWLDEMLNIEEEVKPYILFVRQAFQAALPVRRTVEFDPYRHSHDGVEFDPETIQDQNKWMRANVMRTLKRKVDQGEIDQVNTFCLDASGSMDHEPMRNLFKILYLLILGLEDRKSYDAVHFFNHYFIETANFSNIYTNRKLLFKVLLRIATIGEKGVIYGGGGGTNISDGVEKCHERMMKFIRELKADDPERNIVSSLFVITDGEPSMGIMDMDELRDFIESRRVLDDVAIKGIYIKPEEEEGQFVPHIFGANNFVETTDFHDAVDKFVQIMTQTYKAQRKAFKWKKKQAKQQHNTEL